MVPYIEPWAGNTASQPLTATARCRYRPVSAYAHCYLYFQPQFSPNLHNVELYFLPDVPFFVKNIFTVLSNRYIKSNVWTALICKLIVGSRLLSGTMSRFCWHYCCVLYPLVIYGGAAIGIISISWADILTPGIPMLKWDKIKSEQGRTSFL